MRDLFYGKMCFVFNIFRTWIRSKTGTSKNLSNIEMILIHGTFVGGILTKINKLTYKKIYRMSQNFSKGLSKWENLETRLPLIVNAKSFDTKILGIWLHGLRATEQFQVKKYVKLCHSKAFNK